MSNVLSENILKYRKINGLTQEQLAEKLGVTFQTISKWETGKSMPDVMLLPKLAEIYECAIDDLFSYVAIANRESINIFPNVKKTDELNDYIAKQIRSQVDNNGSSNKILSVIADNISGNFELTDDNIERLLDAYRDLYKGIQKKNIKNNKNE